MLPDCNKGRRSILAVVHQDHPSAISTVYTRPYEANLHSIRIHRLADIEIVVLEVGHNLLGIGRGALLEFGNLGIVGSISFESLLDLLHVGCNKVSFSSVLEGSMETTNS